MDTHTGHITVFLLLFVFQMRDNSLPEHRIGLQIYLPIISKTDQRHWNTGCRVETWKYYTAYYQSLFFWEIIKCIGQLHWKISDLKQNIWIVSLTVRHKTKYPSHYKKRKENISQMPSFLAFSQRLGRGATWPTFYSSVVELSVWMGVAYCSC